MKCGLKMSIYIVSISFLLDHSLTLTTWLTHTPFITLILFFTGIVWVKDLYGISHYEKYTYFTPFNFRPPLIFGRGWPKIRGADKV